MGKRGSAVDDVLTASQFGDLLATAAAIQDRQKSIECFALLLLMGRYGLRAGEMIHANPNWEDPELPGLRIPSYDDCTCGYCQNRAEQRLENGEDDDEAKTFDELLKEYWSPKSSNGARPIPFETERVRDIFERYFDRWGFVDVIIVTHNMQQAARISDKTAVFLTGGRLVEFGDTNRIFENPDNQRVEDYITGKFG